VTLTEKYLYETDCTMYHVHVAMYSQMLQLPISTSE